MSDELSTSKLISVEVAYALPDKQRIISLQVNPGTSAYAAVIQSGIVSEFPDIDPDSNAMGIFAKHLDGKTRPLPKDYELKAGDRVEIYRPLTIDPKQARLQRAESKRASARQGTKN